MSASNQWQSVRTVAGRFIVAVVLPGVGLMAGLLVVVESARGAGEQAGFAAMAVVWLAFVLVPLVPFLNGWLLFGDRRLLRVLGLGLIPSTVTTALALVFVHGSPVAGQFVSLLLAPAGFVFNTLVAREVCARIAVGAYAFALLVLLALAHRYESRRRNFPPNLAR